MGGGNGLGLCLAHATSLSGRACAASCAGWYCTEAVLQGYCHGTTHLLVPDVHVLQVLARKQDLRPERVGGLCHLLQHLRPGERQMGCGIWEQVLQYVVSKQYCIYKPRVHRWSLPPPPAPAELAGGGWLLERALLVVGVGTAAQGPLDVLCRLRLRFRPAAPALAIGALQ